MSNNASCIWRLHITRGIGCGRVAGRQDAAMAGTALSQINKAIETMRNGGNAPSAAFYEQQLPRARAIVARLRGP